MKRQFLPASRRGTRRRGVRDAVAFLTGGALFAAAMVLCCAIVAGWSQASCSGETRPFLGSGRQAFAVHGCLARDAGPLIGIKKALHIYDPHWQTVIR